MGTQDLEELARKGRQVAASQRAAARGQQRQVATGPDRDRRRRLDHAFGSSFKAQFVILPLMVVASAGAVVAMQELRPPRSWEVSAAVVAATTAVAFAVVALLKSRNRRREIAWLRQLPFELDVAHYLDRLNVDRQAGVGYLTATFASPLPADAQAIVVNAIVGAAGDGTAQLVNGALCVQSPQLETRFIRTGDGSYSYFSNRKVHVWFRGCFDGLVAIHARYPIAKVGTEIEP